MTKKPTLILAIVAALWLALFFSNRGVLVWSSTSEEGVVEKLNCRYFIATGFLKREHLKGKILGREACPRWISLAER